MFFAHSGRAGDRRDWEPLPRHLIDVARLAEHFAAAFGLGELARITGLLHDLGKYNPLFQLRLSGSTTPVDHSTAGAALVRTLLDGPDRVFAELAAYAIAGHHAGLPDRRGTSGLAERLAGFDEASLSPSWRSEIDLSLRFSRPAFSWQPTAPALAFQLAMAGRMLFSALVDADFKATESYYARLDGRQPDRQWPALADRLDGLAAALDARLAELGSRHSPVAALRRDVLAHVRAQAHRSPGLFTLTVPTGGGKTLTSLAFALDHARLHGQRRIIYAIPFTAIIDQTARQFRDLFGADIVLEHHSAVDRSADAPDDDETTGRAKLKLAMEDWAAPLVVTTNVQLFESLFAARTAAARKLHNIAGSVIILEEAQTLPPRLLLPILRSIETLARDYGCTIVLCTATQPALDRRNLADGLELENRELAPDPPALARKLRRVTLREAGPLADETLAAELDASPQGLVIVNSRKHALALYETCRTAGMDGLVHLSTRMCAAHRKPMLDDIRERLKTDRPCRVISTSLIEAGVDVDFPRVWRADTGLDSIAQAAGRCNREGGRPVAESIVTVFSAPEQPMPRELRPLLDARQRMQREHADDLFAPAAMTRYFEELYWSIGRERLDRGSDGQPILAGFALDNGGTEFAYRTVAANFRMIESGMVPVVVPFDDTARAAIARLGVPNLSSGRLARELQPYLVQIPPQARNRLISAGRAGVAAPNLRADQFVVLTDLALYRNDTGLIWDDPDYLGVEELVFN